MKPLYLMQSLIFLQLDQIFLRDARPENVKLAKDLKKLYKDTVTKFMREMIKLRKKMK